MSERIARVALSRLSEPGDLRLSRLVAELGATEVYRLLRDEHDIAGVYTDVANRLRGLDPERELEQAAARGIRFVCPDDQEWPEGLAALNVSEPVQNRGGAPLGLWARGALRLDEACANAAAVVGSRSATTYGGQVASDIAAEIGRAGFGVISGAAFGIDQAAHRGALAVKGTTVAVLACGVDRAYPSAHKNLLDYIADVGLIVSELPPGCAPTKLRFLTRNRLIAALSQGTVVVEAAVRSGALSTANWAIRLNRVLMGVPGPVTSAPSEGVHQLIRARGAALVTSGADVMELLAPVGSFMTGERRGPDRPQDSLSEPEQRVLDAVPARQAASTVSIARTCGLATGEVLTVLKRLAGRGFVAEADGLWSLPRSAAEGA